MRLDRLHFDDDLVFDQEVHPVATLKNNTLVRHRRRDLPRDCNAPQGKFVGQTLLIDGFQKPGPESAMHMQPGIDHDSRKPLKPGGSLLLFFSPFPSFRVQS
ncbi:MAG: hypothetical protein JWP35_1844 [Caulobacter sp.]|nr:hypothetical protein [Caulobacter sp.]